MNRTRYMHLAGFLGVLFIFVIINGCFSHRPVEAKFTPEVYEKLDKYPIRIHLELSEEYRSAKIKDIWEIPIGEDLARYSTILANQMFNLVADNEQNVDAVLVVKILSANHLVKMYAGQESRILITQEWILKDQSGKLIWVQTVKGEGVMEMGTAFSEGTRRKERVQLAIDDLFIKSAKEISSSVEIRKFSEKAALGKM